jgi:hypothetical protein
LKMKRELEELKKLKELKT